LASVKCLPLKNMEATIVLAANSPSMVQPLLCHSSQSIPAMRGTERRAAGSLGTFIAPTLLVGSSSGCLLSRQVQAYYSASFAA
jgi:hypothetical protein